MHWSIGQSESRMINRMYFLLTVCRWPGEPGADLRAVALGMARPHVHMVVLGHTPRSAQDSPKPVSQLMV
jgi:hypothetical protein